MKFLKNLLNYSTLGLGALVFLIGAVFLFPSSSNAASESFWVEGNVKEVQNIDDFNGEFIKQNATLLSEIEADIRYYEVQGEYIAEYDAYNYDYTLVKSANENRAVVASPYAFNEKENKMLIKVGISYDMGDTDNQEGVTTRTSEFEQVTLDDKPTIGLFATKTNFHRTKWVDPVNLQVNKVETEMTYNYDGTSVTSYTSRDRREWLSLTGWSETSHNLSHSFVGGRNARAETQSTMSNSSFCIGQPTTNVYYNTNNLTVYFNGSAAGGVSTYASGGCSSWLSYSSGLY